MRATAVRNVTEVLFKLLTSISFWGIPLANSLLKATLKQSSDLSKTSLQFYSNRSPLKFITMGGSRKPFHTNIKCVNVGLLNNMKIVFVQKSLEVASASVKY